MSLNAYAFEGCCAAIDDGQVDWMLARQVQHPLVQGCGVGCCGPDWRQRVPPRPILRVAGVIPLHIRPRKRCASNSIFLSMLAISYFAVLREINIFYVSFLTSNETKKNSIKFQSSKLWLHKYYISIRYIHFKYLNYPHYFTLNLYERIKLGPAWQLDISFNSL
jgi:hypothetical protein